MPSINRITIMGHLGKDPELRHTQGGKPFATFSVATSEKWNDAAGNPQERTEWHNVSVFTKSAEACVKYLKKGSLVYVEGKLQSREYEKNGVKMRAYDISAFDVKFLDGRDTSKPAANTPASGGPSWEELPADSDLPF